MGMNPTLTDTSLVIQSRRVADFPFLVQNILSNSDVTIFAHRWISSVNGRIIRFSSTYICHIFVMFVSEIQVFLCCSTAKNIQQDLPLGDAVLGGVTWTSPDSVVDPSSLFGPLTPPLIDIDSWYSGYSFIFI